MKRYNIYGVRASDGQIDKITTCDTKEEAMEEATALMKEFSIYYEKIGIQYEEIIREIIFEKRLRNY